MSGTSMYQHAASDMDDDDVGDPDQPAAVRSSTTTRNSNVRFSDAIEIVEGSSQLFPESPSGSPQLVPSPVPPPPSGGGQDSLSPLTTIVVPAQSQSLLGTPGKDLLDNNSTVAGVDSRAETPQSLCSGTSSSGRDAMSNSLGTTGGGILQHLYGELPPTPDRSTTPEVLRSTAVYLEEGELPATNPSNYGITSQSSSSSVQQTGGGGVITGNPPWIARRSRQPPPGSLLAGSSSNNNNSNSFTVAYTSPTHRRGAASSRSVSASSAGGSGSATPTKTAILNTTTGQGSSAPHPGLPRSNSIDGGSSSFGAHPLSLPNNAALGGVGSNSSFGNNSSLASAPGTIHFPPTLGLSTTNGGGGVGEVVSPVSTPMMSLVPPAAAARRASLDSNISMAISDCSFIDKGEPPNNNLQQQNSFTAGSATGLLQQGNSFKSPITTGEGSSAAGYLQVRGGSSAQLRASPQPRVSSQNNGPATAQYLLALQSTTGLGKSIKDVLREGYQESVGEIEGGGGGSSSTPSPGGAGHINALDYSAIKAES